MNYFLDSNSSKKNVYLFILLINDKSKINVLFLFIINSIWRHGGTASGPFISVYINHDLIYL